MLCLALTWNPECATLREYLVIPPVRPSLTPGWLTAAPSLPVPIPRWPPLHPYCYELWAFWMSLLDAACSLSHCLLLGPWLSISTIPPHSHLSGRACAGGPVFTPYDPSCNSNFRTWLHADFTGLCSSERPQRMIPSHELKALITLNKKSGSKS